MTRAMKSLYDRLQPLGIKQAFAKKALPKWWDNKIAETPAGLQQAQLYLAKTFNLDLRTLAHPDEAVGFQQAFHKFKLAKNVSSEQASASAHYATAMARLALLAFPSPFMQPTASPETLRQQILQRLPCVDLDGLLAFCWTSGVPVIHLDTFPGKKMMGLLVRIEGRFAIVLSKKAHPAYLLFHLAHELGHLAYGHLAEEGFIADVTIDQSDYGDASEKEADAFAIRLLNGAEVQYGTDGHFRSGVQLFHAAKRVAEARKVDVGHILLNYGHTQNDYKLPNLALRQIPGPTCGAEVINAALFEHLDLTRLSEDQIALLRSATDCLVS